MIVGIVAAKQNSKRFPQKNVAKIDGIPLFWHAVKPLLECELVDHIYVITNSPIIAAYCREPLSGVSAIWRPKNAARDDDKLISILRWGYYNLNMEYDTIVAIQANCHGHNATDVRNCIELKQEKKLLEVRSVDEGGCENGILVLDKSVMQDNRDISYYIGAISTCGIEVHVEADLP